MSTLRNLRTTLPLSVLLLALGAGPALAQPAPLDDGALTPGRGPATSTGSSDPSTWMTAGLGAAAAFALMLVVLLVMAMARHSHHTAHPA